MASSVSASPPPPPPAPSATLVDGSTQKPLVGHCPRTSHWAGSTPVAGLIQRPRPTASRASAARHARATAAATSRLGSPELGSRVRLEARADLCNLVLGQILFSNKPRQQRLIASTQRLTFGRTGLYHRPQTKRSTGGGGATAVAPGDTPTRSCPRPGQARGEVVPARDATSLHPRPLAETHNRGYPRCRQRLALSSTAARSAGADGPCVMRSAGS